MSKTILVTGGAGFIGSNFIFNTIDKHPEDRILCVDSLTYAGNIGTIKRVIDENKLEFFKTDICDCESINKIIRENKPDYIVNFAAESHVDRSIVNPKIFFETNIIGTSTLMDAAIKYGVKRFHQVSTDEVYGDLPLDRKDLLFTENTPLRPSSPYSSSKASADLLAMAYYRTYKLPITISRCSNNYGPYQFPEKLIPLMIIKALCNQKLPIYGDGLNVRDWIYVKDHCNAIDVILRNGKCGEIYNVGSNNEKSNIEIVKLILNQLKKQESLIDYVKDRAGHDRRYAINPCKIHKELKWKPEIDFDTGLRITIEWYVKNKTWVNSIINKTYLKSNSGVLR